MRIRFTVLLLAGALLGMSACSPSPGREAYTMSGCPTCHGPDLEGTRTGPPLKDLAALWTRESLDGYLNVARNGHTTADA